MLSRLLWKEFRESWLVLLVSAIAPVFTLLMLTSKSLPPAQRDIIALTGMSVTPVVVMLWAIRKGGQRKEDGKTPLMHLPVDRFIEFSVSVLLPLAISVLIGLWFGRHLPNVAAQRLQPGVNQMGVELAIMYFPAAFAGCYVVSAAISSWAGLFAGLTWTCVGLMWVTSLYQTHVSQSQSYAWAELLFRTALGAVLCLLLFLLLSYKRQFRAGRLASMILLAAIIFTPFIRDRMNKPSYTYYPTYWGARACSPDRSLYMSQQEPTVPGKVGTVIEMMNYATGWSSTRAFNGCACPITFDSAGHGYVARQDTKSLWVRVLVWDRSEIKEIARIARVPGWSTAVYQSVGSVSPDRHYLAFYLRSRMGRGYDMWVLNLRGGESWIAIPNNDYPIMRASWQADRLLLPDIYRIWSVNLRTKESSHLHIPGEDGG